MKNDLFRILLLLLLVARASGPLHAQENVPSHIRGMVQDLHKKTPLEDVRVELCHRDKVCAIAFTDASGRYSLELPSLPHSSHPMHLRFVMLGYRTTTVSWTPRKGSDIPLVRMEENSDELDEVLVSSTRTERKIVDIPVPSMVIGQSQIKRIAPATTRDILTYAIPGVEYHLHGGITHITMQGFKADYLVFLIDGEEMAGLKSGSLDLLRISPNQIERVEVVKGAGSALYGSNAIGGVINIITKDNRKPLSLNASLGYTSPSQWSEDLSVALRRGKWNNITALSHQKDGGYEISTKDNSKSFSVFKNNVYRLSNKMSYRPLESFSLKWNLGGDFRQQVLNDLWHDHYYSFFSTLKGVHTFSESSSLSTSYHMDYSRRDRYYPQAKEDKVDYKHGNLKHMIRLQYDYISSPNSTLNLGVEGHEERLLSDQIEAAKSSKSIRYGVLYAQHVWKPLSLLQLMYGLRSDLHSSYGLNLSPKFTMLFSHGGLHLRGGYSGAFRSPTMMEMFYNWSHRGMFVIYGNPDLKPEKAHQWLVGGAYSLGPISMEAGLKYTQFRDRIVMYEDGASDQRHKNVEGKSSMTTVDMQFAWHVVQGVSLYTSYVYSRDPVWINTNGRKVNVSTTRPHNLQARIEGYKSWKDWSFSVTLMGQYLSAIRSHYIDSKSGNPHALNYDGYTMLRLSTNTMYKQRYTFTMGVDNLLNFRPSSLGYQTASLSPGRVPFMRISVNLP